MDKLLYRIYIIALPLFKFGIQTRVLYMYAKQNSDDEMHF